MLLVSFNLLLIILSKQSLYTDNGPPSKKLIPDIIIVFILFISPIKQTPQSNFVI
ncbi:hypothetical protein LL033_14325 [Clostridium estertheticum]|nr:hypothetical protein [Clostridium estertheticum]WAG53830.1 hypothetical protein LL033_14325 [Clostridium estertheticum]